MSSRNNRCKRGGGGRRNLGVDEFETDVADKTCAKVNCSGH
jgi:hypothetical protein